MYHLNAMVVMVIWYSIDERGHESVGMMDMLNAYIGRNCAQYAYLQNRVWR